MPEPLSTEESIGTLFTRAVDDAGTYARAEIAVYRARLLGLLKEAKFVAIFGVVALVLANAAVIALLVGLVLTLQPSVGPGWATLIVVGITLLVAGLLGWRAGVHVRKLRAGPSVK